MDDSNLKWTGGLRELITKLKKVDIESPPGIAGQLCEDIAKTENRALSILRPAAALSILSICSSNRKNVDNEKMSLFMLATALSGAGKEAHIRYVKSVIAGVGMSESSMGKPRSDRVIMQDVFEHLTVSYIMDEGHELFSKALSDKAPSYESGIGDLLLELKTTKRFNLSGNLAKAFSQEFQERLNSLNSKSSHSADDLEELDKLTRKLDYIKNGLPDPFVSILSYSTPTKSDFLINEKSILSGFIGRFIIWNGPGLRGNLIKDKTQDVPSESLIARCKLLLANTEKIQFSGNCQPLLDTIYSFFERPKLLNHPQLGALYARGCEHVKSIASVLAAETGLITCEMLLYATRVFLHNVTRCSDVLNGAIKKSENQMLKNAEETVKRITQKKGFTSKGVLANSIQKCDSLVRKHQSNKNSKIHYNLLEKLIAEGTIVEIDGKVAHKSILNT